LAGAFFADEAPAGWIESLRREAQGNWKTLERCMECGGSFAIDEWDKLQPRVVVRVDDVGQWEIEADDVDTRKALLLRSRGGLQDTECEWVGCLRPQVRGVAICLEHLWNLGVRR
jgi:hypothetical protein